MKEAFILQIYDPLYGHFTLEEMLHELILSKPLQRLKRIHQGGASYLVNPKWDTKRYDHSVGTMLLVRHLGGSLEEQAAALLHDVSHTAFSHVIDYVFNDEEESYHEEIFMRTIEQSDIPYILNRHGFHPQEIVGDLEQWKRLEQAAPDLCADRIDYTLRDLHHHGTISTEEIDLFLTELQYEAGKLYVRSVSAAEWFVDAYQQLVLDYFLHPLNIYAYNVLSSLLKLALQKGHITKEDFLADDQTVIAQLKQTGDREILQLLDRLTPSAQAIESMSAYDIHWKTKPRIVDPLVRQEGKWYRASELSTSIKRKNEQALEKLRSGSFIKILV
jgi:HD superfamily phosphohydrolase